MKSIIKYVDKLFFKEYKLTAETLGCFRIFFSLYIIFIVGIPDYRVLSELPDFIYDPPMLSIASLSSAFPEYSFLFVISGLIFFLYFFVLFGYKTKYSSFFLTLLLILGNSFYYSIGKINHSDMITVWVPLLMGFAGWGKAFSIDAYTRLTAKNKDNTVEGWPVFMLVSLLAFGMFAAGLPKLFGGWLDPSTQAVRGYLLNFYFVQERQLFLAPLFEKFSLLMVWESFDYFAVFFELGFLIVLLRRKYFQLYVVLGLIFHIMNLLILNIAFLDNIAVYMIFFPFWMIRLERFEFYLRKVFSRKSLLMVTSLFFALYFLIGWKITIHNLVFDTVISKEVFELAIMVSVLLLYTIGLYYQKNISIEHSFLFFRK